MKIDVTRIELINLIVAVDAVLHSVDVNEQRVKWESLLLVLTNQLGEYDGQKIKEKCTVPEWNE